MAGRVAIRDLAMRLMRLSARNNLKTYGRCYTLSSRWSPWFCADSVSNCTQQSNNAWNQLSGRCFGGGNRIAFRAYSGSQGVTGGTSGTGPGVFGDLTAQSGIRDDMLDSLIALKDFGDIEGLPALDVILEQDEERDRKAIRRELEKKKQLELASKRVKTVDELGRSYATGRRKMSTARVWLMEGDGKITINGKPHDLYFPDIDQRVQILEPFLQTNQLGVFNVRATVQGGGISGFIGHLGSSRKPDMVPELHLVLAFRKFKGDRLLIQMPAVAGQSGALRHGISKALQLYDPTFRQSLKSAGMLTRDSRVVERKKPGKAKARKSYQWVKR